jgi:hypothetical protein
MSKLGEVGKHYSFDGSLGYGVILSDEWFMAIERSETLDGVPIWEIRTYDFLPCEAIELNIYDSNAKIPLEISLAFAAAIHATMPSTNSQANVPI